MNQPYNPFGADENAERFEVDAKKADGAVPPGQNADPYYQNPSGYTPPQTNGQVPPKGYYQGQPYSGRPPYHPPYSGANQAPDFGYYNTPQQQAYMRRQNEKWQQIQLQKREIRRFGNTIGLAVLAYFLLQVLLSGLLVPLNLYDLYADNMVFQSCFNVICISLISVALPFGIVALVNKSHYAQPIVPAKKQPASRVCLWVGFGMLCCIAANCVVSFGVVPLFKAFGYELKSNDLAAPDSVFACVVALIATAIVPAICEEFAMRCCSVQLLRKYGKGFAVLSVSIVFGLLHGNVIQFVFAFLVGLVLGYVTVKTDNIVPAILIHAFNNGMSVVSDIFSYAVSDKAGEVATAVLFLFWAVAGAVCALVLLWKKEFNRREKPQPDYNAATLTFGQKMFSFFVTPGMIISFIPLILLTISTIQKV